MSTAYHHILTTLQTYASAEKAQILQRFFKTGKGEYGEGDKFLGVTVPDIRKVAKQYLCASQSGEKNLNITDIESLLHSERHEARMCALLMLVELCKPALLRKGGEPMHRLGGFNTYEGVNLYLRHTAYINNRDLVDLSAPAIIGHYYFDKDRSKLYELAASPSLRERRIAIIATFYFIKKGQHEDTFRLAELLLQDQHDLIQKAV